MKFDYNHYKNKWKFSNDLFITASIEILDKNERKEDSLPFLKKTKDALFVKDFGHTCDLQCMQLNDIPLWFSCIPSAPASSWWDQDFNNQRCNQPNQKERKNIESMNIQKNPWRKTSISHHSSPSWLKRSS